MQRLLPGSARITAAIDFGRHLDLAMKRRGVGKGPLAEAAKVSKAAIGEYRRGRNLPTLATAARLSSSLRSPKLLSIVEDARRGACSTCGGLVWQDGGRPTLYCSNPCRTIGASLGYARQRRGTRVDREALQGVVDGYRDAVEGFCGDCPDNDHGFCGFTACPLFAVSSVRAASDKEAVPVVKPDPYDSPQASANRSAGLRRAHQERPEWAEQTGRLSRQRHAAMTPAEKQAWKKSISDAKRVTA